LRGQILYRLAEMLESRRSAMQDELVLGGTSKAAASKELDTAIALVVWHAGLCDKVQALLGSQNAVQGPFFNFTTVEPCGVVGVLGREAPALVGTLALVLPLLVSGNTVVALVGEQAPFAGLVLGEACASSDLPGGVLNLLSGSRSELAPQFAAHRDLDGLLIAGTPDAALSAAAADNVQARALLRPAGRCLAAAESLCSAGVRRTVRRS
jgi:acyl-CoA reductase-like NAD-dependent aldehyde dehydrogenase